LIRALIFDFDGLILDTEGPVFQSWQELFHEFGVDLTLEAWADYIGRSEDSFDFLDRLEAQLGHPVDRAAIVPRRRRREDELIAMQPVLPGVREYLDRASQLGLKIGAASSASCAWVTGHLERLELWGYFDCIQAADDVRCTKPNPELYLQALEGLGIKPAEAIALEDSPNGVLAARRAGLFCVAVPNRLTRQLPLDQADLRLDSLADLSLDQMIAIADQT